MITLELIIVILLMILNGFFAMSELAVVSVRKARLQPLAEAGNRGARAALGLAAEPGRLLSTVQTGITLIGIFAGAYSGATLAQGLGDWLRQFPAVAGIANGLSLGLVVAAITYLSLIIGELVPKHLALRNPERIAAAVARPMMLLAWLASPVVWVLDASTRLVLRLLGGTGASANQITDEEIRTLLAEATRAGVVEPAEQAMISGVMRLADRPVRMIMTPRPDVVWLDLNDDPTETLQCLRDSRHSRFPVGRGNIDEVIGVIQAKDLLIASLEGRGLALEGMLREPVIVPDTVGALEVLELIKRSALKMALVIDEYGNLEGLVTATDILESIVGEMVREDDSTTPEITRREDGSWLVDGSLAVDELKELLKLRSLPHEEDFHTVAGLLLNHFAEIPKAGDHFDLAGFRFEVMDMDGFRIDKVLIASRQND
ncbi:MAG: hemolysin family protein [Candidatus Competibacteraceae bacterium]